MKFELSMAPRPEYPKRVLVIEPHGDDALLSAYSALRAMEARSHEYEVHILTFSERPSHGLCDFFPQSLKTSTFFNLPDLSWFERPKVNSAEINRLYKNGENVYRFLKESVKSAFGDRYEEALQVGYREFNRYLGDSLLYDLFIVPFGVDHPYHFLVSDVFGRLILDNPPMTQAPTLYYVEKPYIAKRYVRQVVESEIRNTTPGESIKDVTSSLCDYEKHQKREAFVKAYPKEASMLRFSSDVLIDKEDRYLYIPYHEGVKPLVKLLKGESD